MTNNKPTDERLSLIIAETLGVTAARGEYASVEVSAALFVSVLTELQEYRKASSEPVGAPDAWLWKKKTGYITAGVSRPMYEPLYSAAIPLYAAPQPLTDAERAELQEYRKAALEMRALITSEICDFFAGLEQPGDPKGAQAMQSELLLRFDVALAGCLVAPKFTEEF